MSTDRDPLYQAFQDIFHLWYDPLCNFACSFLKDNSASEDIVQEVFMRIWQDRPDLIGTDGIRYYLFTAVRNNCISALRRDGKGILKPLDDEDAIDTINVHDTGETDYMSLVAIAIEHLPPACKRVFLLSKVANMSYKDIAGMLGISTRTVENQVGKALRLIRAFLKEKGAWVAWSFPVIVNFLR